MLESQTQSHTQKLQTAKRYLGDRAAIKKHSQFIPREVPMLSMWRVARATNPVEGQPQ